MSYEPENQNIEFPQSTKKIKKIYKEAKFYNFTILTKIMDVNFGNMLNSSSKKHTDSTQNNDTELVMAELIDEKPVPLFYQEQTERQKNVAHSSSRGVTDQNQAPSQRADVTQSATHQPAKVDSVNTHPVLQDNTLQKSQSQRSWEPCEARSRQSSITKTHSSDPFSENTKKDDLSAGRASQYSTPHDSFAVSQLIANRFVTSQDDNIVLRTTKHLALQDDAMICEQPTKQGSDPVSRDDQQDQISQNNTKSLSKTLISLNLTRCEAVTALAKPATSSGGSKKNSDESLVCSDSAGEASESSFSSDSSETEDSE